MIDPKTDPSTRRIVYVVAEDNEAGGGRPILYAYGTAWAAELGRCTRELVRTDQDRDKLDMSRPESVVAWALARLGEHEAAAKVRALARGD